MWEWMTAQIGPLLIGALSGGSMGVIVVAILRYKLQKPKVDADVSKAHIQNKVEINNYADKLFDELVQTRQELGESLVVNQELRLDNAKLAASNADLKEEIKKEREICDEKLTKATEEIKKLSIEIGELKKKVEEHIQNK